MLHEKRLSMRSSPGSSAHFPALLIVAVLGGAQLHPFLASNSSTTAVSSGWLQLQELATCRRGTHQACCPRSRDRHRRCRWQVVLSSTRAACPHAQNTQSTLPSGALAAHRGSQRGSPLQVEYGVGTPHQVYRRSNQGQAENRITCASAHQSRAGYYYTSGKDWYSKASRGNWATDGQEEVALDRAVLTSPLSCC